MDQQEWKKVSDIVDTALDLKGQQRYTFIQEQCGGDEHLKSQVTRLLESIEQSFSEDFLENTEDFPRHLAADFSKDEQEFASSMIGETIDQYTITKLIGHGGMGSVFLAERADEAYDRPIALKVLRRGMDTPSNIARFKRERNILANLDHSNIARLLDGGVTEAGLPYLVMEYVEGISLLDYCDSKRLKLNQRLSLFKDVCKAVHHAHKNATIHRDLKPSNILVTEDGAVKVLDFGIAKLLEPEDSESTLLQTRTGAHMLTLGYAAPEQLESKTITTATDSYTLGILLYELLAGAHPFEMSDKDLTEIEQIIRNEEPRFPSKRFKNLSTGKQKKLARKQNSTASAIIKQLRGDLDAIIMKALRKESEARYSSAEQLLEDLNRRKENLPVIAREDTFSYYSSKFLRRHKTELIIAAGFLLLVIGFAGFYTLRITEERNQAQLEAKKAQQVSEFLTELFQAGDPDFNPTETVTASMLLERGEQQISQLKDQPQVQAQLASVMGTAYRNLGNFEKAEPLLEQNRKLIKNSIGEFSLEYADALHKFGYLEHDMHNVVKAESLHRKELAIRRSLPKREPLKIAKSLNRLGVMLDHQNKYQAADSVHREALEIFKNIDGSHPEIRADILNSRANTLEQMDELELAKELVQQALVLRKKNLGEIHRKVSITYNILADIMDELGELEEAASLYHKSLQILNQIYETPHPATARTSQKLGSTLREMGKLNKAEQYARQALAMRLEIYGEMDSEVAMAYNNLAVVLEWKGQIKAADSLYHKSLKISKLLNNGPNNDIALALENLGTMYQREKRYEKAENYHIQSLDMYKELREIPDSDISEQINELAELYSDIAPKDSVLTLLKKALTFDEKSFDESSMKLGHIKLLFGHALMHAKNYADAERLLTEGYQLFKEQNASQPHITKAQNYLSKLYEAAPPLKSEQK